MVEKILNKNCSVCKEPHKSCETCGFVMSCKCPHNCDTGDYSLILNKPVEVLPVRETNVGWSFVFRCANSECSCRSSGEPFSTTVLDKATEHSMDNKSAMFISKEAT